METDLWHRLSDSRWLLSLTDNAWTYGAGLGVVSAPVILYLRGLFQNARGKELVWMAFVAGTVGMVLAGETTYAVARKPRGPLDRALLLTLTTTLLALLYASLPFVLF
jgi:hypothetical protein